MQSYTHVNMLQWSSLSLHTCWALPFQACPTARLSHVRNFYERLSKTSMTNIWLLAAIKHVFYLRQAWTSMLASFPKIINNVSWDMLRESWEAICIGLGYVRVLLKVGRRQCLKYPSNPFEAKFWNLPCMQNTASSCGSASKILRQI